MNVMRVRSVLLSFAAVAAALAAVPRSAALASSVSLPAMFANPADRSVTTSQEAVGATSRNWSGYVAQSQYAMPFTTVHARWTQPSVVCRVDQSYTVFWVGFDGWGNGTVEQAGTAAYCDLANAPARYYSWWEMYPDNSITWVFPIKPGDVIDTRVSFKNGIFTMNVDDLTSGKTFTQKARCGTTCPRDSAEWVTESPYGSDYYPLADWGTMSYKSGTTTAGNVQNAIVGPNWFATPITMVDANGAPRATVGPLTNRLKGFKSTFVSL